MLKEIAKEKLSEVVKAIVPIVAIVLILSVTIVPMPTHVVMVFFYGHGETGRRPHHKNEEALSDIAVRTFVRVYDYHLRT